MIFFYFILIFSFEGYAQDSLKRLEVELKYLQDRETFLYLPKKDLLLEKTDEVKVSSSSILKSPVGQDDLLKEMEEETGFKETPINVPETE